MNPCTGSPHVLQRKYQTRPFLEKGRSPLNILLGFLHPGSRAGGSPRPGPGARRLTWRGVSRGAPRASHPRKRKRTFATSRSKMRARDRTKQNLPRLTHQRLRGGMGGDLRRLPESCALQGLGKSTQGARRGGQTPPSLGSGGQVGLGAHLPR